MLKTICSLWPFVLRSTYERVRAENSTLRDALREANNELRKHRLLIDGIAKGTPDVIDKLERVLLKRQA